MRPNAEWRCERHEETRSLLKMVAVHGISLRNLCVPPKIGHSGKTPPCYVEMEDTALFWSKICPHYFVALSTGMAG